MSAILREESSIISDPLAWQEAIERHGIGVNLRGSDRFWATVETISGLEIVYRDGVPEFTEIVFRLKDNIGLRLFTDRIDVAEFDAEDHDIRVWINFEFCEIEETRKAEWEQEMQS